MPELDFLTLANYAHAENGLVTMVGAGVDKVVSQSFPVLHNIGVAARLTFTPSECAAEHVLQLVFRRESHVLGSGPEMPVRIEPPPAGLPPGWPAGLVMAFNMPIPLEAPGVYHVDLRIDGTVAGTVSFIVVPQQAQGQV